MTQITAKIHADSVTEQGHRLTTFELEYPRFIHAELMTHRLFSRNASSSRAIPAKTMRSNYIENHYTPTQWMKDHKGMQGTEYFTDQEEINKLHSIWSEGIDLNHGIQKRLSDIGLSKQWANRWIEMPSMYKIIVTATEYDNFFKLRAHPQAQNEINELAVAMREAMAQSTPKELKAGEWHIPFGENLIGVSEEDKVKIATARCARISYGNFEGKNDFEADIRLYNNLSKQGHYSPFEHCAKAMNSVEYNSFAHTYLDKTNSFIYEHGWCRNFRGFIQLRSLID